MIGRSNRARRAGAVLSAAVLAGMAWPGSARSADVWDNTSGDASWFTPANWADDTVPTPADAVTLPIGFPERRYDDHARQLSSPTRAA